ncbi:four-carbon acid sugar kinase family protein [Acidisoma cellulosilytica]|uniref:3-oxo-tetronate kinase n=1 Tax=Acidisoma cellulosilyticum TaxID=2802395 RepID=A0A964E520_9PROT|nr:3-oxo-tetronate kinase [Acidisoma cellulosilyticum]MCB8882240.1 four-carbon acid sugar kinase family protein [Acidisoma cellulosilyticum]
MTLALGCIADDYTGASDLANTLARQGLRTVQTIGLPAAAFDLSGVDAVVVALKSRSIPAAEAVAASQAAEVWLRQKGADHVLFKICSTFDSTDAGNIGPVSDALRDSGACPMVVVTPAFPGTGRTVFQGNLFVGVMPLNESPLKDHPLNPMHDANLMRVLSRQTATRIGLVPLQIVDAGPDALRAKLAQLQAEGFGMAIVDAVFDRHLLTIGAVTLGYTVSTGASGLGLGLAAALIASGRVAKAEGAAAAEAPVGGQAAILAGSCSAATLAQIDAFAGQGPILRLDAERLLADAEAEVAAALDWAKPRLAAGPLLIASSAAPDQVAAMRARPDAESTGHRIEQAMAAIAEGLVQAGTRRLIVAGGETSGAVVDRLSISGFRIGAEIAPGVPVLRAMSGQGPDLLMALKSGNFGGTDFFTDALALMH